MPMSQSEEIELGVRYRVPRWSPEWAVPEVPVPESDVHDYAIDYLKGLLLAWAAGLGRSIKIARNLGIRWVEAEPRCGFDPDLCVIEPAPPDAVLTSLKLWIPGHVAPRLAIEIVSPGHPYKDYVDTPDRAAACGVRELWVYDPLMAGPNAHGGPHLLQVWRRTETGGFERAYAGSGVCYSAELGAWLHPRASRTALEATLVLSDDEAGQTVWLDRTTRALDRATRAEHAAREARARQEHAEQAEREAHALRQTEQQAREEAEARLRGIEAELAVLKAGSKR
jgi:hypothetical protein